ncbi:MAG: NHLP leader peptide family natural product precursor [Firmicutes bacterium]|jgi:hypothetical protein|nr:NHLP leader peptide family natural product precursor [Bacillota bacterium]
MSENLLAKKVELERKVIEKALKDEAYKAKLLSDPHGAIAEFGVQISKDVEIKVLEETANVVYLVLPYMSDELSDEALEDVAGGVDPHRSTPQSMVMGGADMSGTMGGAGMSGTMGGPDGSKTMGGQQGAQTQGGSSQQF